MKYDVAVVGAGPSGAWTATLLAERGARVALIDPSHPREKPCGGGVTARALELVARHVSAPQLQSVNIRQARFLDSPRGSAATVALEHPAQALVVTSRRHFDGLLLDAAERAGVDAIQARVSDLDVSDQGVRIALQQGSSLTAEFVVGADGANSLVRRRNHAAFRRDQLSMATGVFAHGITSEEIVIEMVLDPPGYIWSFPRPDHLAVGICAQADAGVPIERLRTILHDWLKRTGIADGARLESYAWPIPSLNASDFKTVSVSGSRWLTVGDAAGLVDPITREGIFFALQSAVIAADILASSSPNREARYQERVRSDIGQELARAARYKAGFFRPRFAGLLVDALRISPSVRAVMADLVAGTQSYRDLKWRLLKTMELGLVWRWLRGAA